MRNIIAFVCSLSIAGSSAISAASPARPHPFSVDDMIAMERLGEPILSPDGKWVVYTRQLFDTKENKSTKNLWLVSVDGKINRQITNSKLKSNSSPAWSPDSTAIAFLSNRTGTQQIWTASVDGGAEQQLTRLPLDVSNIRWSPDGSHLSFSAEVYPDTSSIDATGKRDHENSENPSKAMQFDRLMVRHWDTWFDGKRSHLFVATIKKTGARWSFGAPIDIMSGIDADSPPKPFGGIEDYAWSPDGTEIAYTAQLGRDMAWSTDLDVFLVPVTGGISKSITEENNATDRGPVYSPDGMSIAYLAMSKPGFEADRQRITLYDRKTGKSKSVADNWDVSPSALAWSKDSQTLFVTVEQNARQKIFALDIKSNQPRELVGNHYNSSLSTSGNRLAFAQDSLQNPVEIWTSKTDGSELLQLTHVNDSLLKSIEMSSPEEFHFSGAQNEKVQAWILKPVGFALGKKFPVAFIIHGGPQGAIADHFSYRWNPQTYTGAGYAVVIVNFHGSTGFGQAFTDSISGDWGGKPFEDLMKGLDFALEKYTWLDGDRVAALGASYGGWMINWINGHTDRFKCLVNHDGIFDAFGMYYATEELWFMEWEFKGTPVDNPELYRKFSPSGYVSNWKTPTLVIHGGKDFRIPDSEGISTFTALQRLGIPSKFLYFPDENHWVLKQKNSVIWHQTVLAWLDQWLKNNSVAQAKGNNAFDQ